MTKVGRKGNIGGTSVDVDIAHVGWYDIAAFAAPMHKAQLV